MSSHSYTVKLRPARSQSRTTMVFMFLDRAGMPAVRCFIACDASSFTPNTAVSNTVLDSGTSFFPAGLESSVLIKVSACCTSTPDARTVCLTANASALRTLWSSNLRCFLFQTVPETGAVSAAAPVVGAVSVLAVGGQSCSNASNISHACLSVREQRFCQLVHVHVHCLDCTCTRSTVYSVPRMRKTIRHFEPLETKPLFGEIEHDAREKGSSLFLDCTRMAHSVWCKKLRHSNTKFSPPNHLYSTSVYRCETEALTAQ